MPKFSKCSYPLHDDQVKDFHNIKLIDPRAHGLVERVNAFKNTVAAGGGVRIDKTSPKICNLCLKKKFSRKRDIFVSSFLKI